MEVLVFFLVVVALLSLLGWAAGQWGVDSRSMHINEGNASQRRSNW